MDDVTGTATSTRSAPVQTVRARKAVAATADQLATQAAMAIFARGGNAVDAAIAANAAIAVTAPHLCGLGGDLFALVHTPDGEIAGLNSSGRAGSRADAAELRAEGLTELPMRHDPRAVTVPGCVDGWDALHARYASLPLDVLLGPAIALAADGFPASPLLHRAVGVLDERGRAELAELADQVRRPGAVTRRPGVALTLQGIAAGGRDRFYGGAFGEGLTTLPGSPITEADVRTSQAEWVPVTRRAAFGVELCTIPPNSQGYLLLAIAAIADRAGLPGDPEDPAWAHLLIEAAKVASHDRPAVLHDQAGGDALVDAAIARATAIDPLAAWPVGAPAAAGDTTYLCTADGNGWAVSLIQSNAAGFGSWLVEPTTGINLHNRGLGFSLIEGHPAELKPGRRPPHTLLPAMTTRDGRLVAVLGTMGGDAQPQIVAQLAARLFAGGGEQGAADIADVAAAVAAPRWVLRGAGTGFDTWTGAMPSTVVLEAGSPALWHDELAARGHRLAEGGAFSSEFGHANAIVIEPDGTFAAAADPRAVVGSAAGI